MFKPNGLNLLCLLSLHQVAYLLEGNVQSPITGPLEDKVFYVEEGKGGPQYLYMFTFQPPTYSVKLIGETDDIIDVKGGVLTVSGVLDWEHKTQYRLQLEGLDQNSKRVQGPYSIIINVVDINDNPPEFSKTEYIGEVREHSRPGKPFMYVTAFDRDDPSTLHAQLIYSIVHQFPRLPGTDMYFQIDNVTGAISTTAAGKTSLDSTKGNAFLLVVRAKDMAGQYINSFSHEADVKITVLENLWKSPPEVFLQENSTKPHPMIITHVQWNDPYATYKIQEKEKHSIPFTVDQNGTVYVTKPLDREEKDYYSFYIFANDEEGNMLAKPVNVSVRVVDINDNPPVCNEILTKFEVQENEDVGNLIGIVVASDNDEKGSLNSRLKFSLMDQTPKIPQDNLFRIELGTGSVHLLKSELNRQVVQNYYLQVNVTDPVFSTICEVQIHVIDINDKIPIFEKSDYGTVIVAEDQKKGYRIFEIKATDADEVGTGSSQIIYTITKGDPNNSFTILTDPDTNIGAIIINKDLDFETNSVYNLTINATNPEPLVAGIKYTSNSSTFLRIHVTDVEEPPVFLRPSYIVAIYENVTIGTSVTTVKAFDPEGYTIKYSLKKTRENWLKIDPDSGQIYTAALLDYEQNRTYIEEIVATEQSGVLKSSVAQLILHLTDVNDNPPYLVNEIVSLCHPLQGDKSAKFEVADLDSDIPNFTYSLAGKYEDNWIISKVDSKHGSITPKNLKLEQNVYDVLVRINDNGRPPMKDVVTLKVNVCRCVSDRCYVEIDNPNPSPTVGATIGILVGVLLVIGIILGFVFLHLKRKKENEQNITPEMEAFTQRSK
ncbi:PREDICTED: cadherin-17-like [Thamnophis sirtalis]|uniref:Cadherin-17-like n=1 Tax=Thamnophis sirtalis TaxID=35019 RepID=A0A6I9Y223_9SAUR|nr:PREDICTED: cadherin-17-like [Thamnophis sirtalis]XP_013921053.1 PREDICTED: cadherin-17-like [Thamnophis sirtalis]